MGLFSKKEKDVNQTTYGFVNEKGISMETAQKLQEEFLQIMKTTDDQSKQINAAAKLMTSGAYQQCITAYSLIMEKYPNRKPDCEMNIGACYFFLGDYDNAIEHYLISKEQGMDQAMIDDNVWEACEKAFAAKKEQSYIHKYIQLFPAGTYLKKARNLLA
jgi:Tetratricopeptide repeat.